jgi:hypothetical protein
MDIISDKRYSNRWIWIEVRNLALRLAEIENSDIALRTQDMPFSCYLAIFPIKPVR